MASAQQNTPVIVIADDPIEAGMLALDLVQAGLNAQAVRDSNAVLAQLLENSATSPGVCGVVVSARRELVQTVELAQTLQGTGQAFGFVAVILRSQQEAAEVHARQMGWNGLAVRPVNADELVTLVLSTQVRTRPDSDAVVKSGSLSNDSVLDVLNSFVERIPRPGGGKDMVIDFESQGRVGQIAIVDGELVHAEIDGEMGRHCLERLCCWRVGSYSVEPRLHTGQATLSGSTMGLLAVGQEYARRVEEARANSPYTDCVCTVRWERVRPLPVVAEAMFRRIASGVVLGEALNGDGDDELEAFAALENRIKRGAVMPQIETASAAGAAPNAGDSARGSSIMQAAQRVAPQPYRPASAFSAVPMTLVDAPEMPQWRAHPTTHVYRVGDDNKVFENADTMAIDTATPGSAKSDQPPALPKSNGGQDASRIGGGKAARVTPLAVHAVDIGAPSVPTSNSTRPATAKMKSAAHQGVIYTPASRNASAAPVPVDPLAASRRGVRTPKPATPESVSVSGQRKGLVTGWFGVQALEDEQSADGSQTLGRGDDVPLRTRGPSGGIRISSHPGDEAPRVGARPYAWMPSTKLEVEEHTDPIIAPPLQIGHSKWPLLIGGALLIAVLTAVALWPGRGEHAADSSVSAQGDRAYRRAVSLMDSNQSEQALKLLGTIVQAPSFVPEALLHLGVLEAEAGQMTSARGHLDKYIANTHAQHAARARRLYKHLFGEAAAEAAHPPATTAAQMPAKSP